MKKGNKRRRRIFFNVSLILTGGVVFLFVFPKVAYHIFLFFLVGNGVETVCPNAELTNRQLILDTRKKEEFEISHLEKARWVGFTKFDVNRLAHLPKDTAILVYCSVGYRSEKVGRELLDAGFTNVKNLYGGIFEWKNEGLPVYRNAVETDSVHVFGKGWGIFLRNGKRVL